jgi:uncharacterized protein YdcH (DUF465 family)
MEKTLRGRDPGASEQRDEIAGLQRRHEELEQRLAVLDRHLALSATEQAERSRLKKEKLQVKDRLLQLQSASRPH